MSLPTLLEFSKTSFRVLTTRPWRDRFEAQAPTIPHFSSFRLQFSVHYDG